MTDVGLEFNTSARSISRARWLVLFSKIVISLSIPILLAMISVRLVMTPTFLTIEYTRPDFPADSYGFTTADRLEYGPIPIEYLLNGEGITFLENVRLPLEKCWQPDTDATDCTAFNARERKHMQDVKTLSQGAYGVAIVVGIALIGIGMILWRGSQNRPILFWGLFYGSILTLSIIATIVVISIAAWDTLFTSFHEIFFESGTWRFLYSDTLIRLYPEQFWFDAAITVGILIAIGASIVFFFARRGLRHHNQG